MTLALVSLTLTLVSVTLALVSLTLTLVPVTLALVSLTSSGPQHGRCGAVAGLTAQSMTYPLDVVRRRMQIQGFVPSAVCVLHSACCVLRTLCLRVCASLPQSRVRATGR